MPQQSIDAAKAAISAAQNAGASQFAQAELTKAQGLLNGAISQMQAKNIFQAKSLAEQAKAVAELALKNSQQKKAPAPTSAATQPIGKPSGMSAPAKQKGNKKV
jgi:hypothetical protein